jgi:hypothetical protein
MKVNNIYSIICLVIILLLTNQAWAADWKVFASSGSGDVYYDKKSIVRVNKNIVHVWTKKTYSEQGKLEEYSFLKSLGKAPGNPYILSHELKLLEIECLNKKIKISSDRICDKRGHIVVTTTPSYGKLNDIVRKSSDEELQNIVCSDGRTPDTKQK